MAHKTATLGRYASCQFGK